MSENLIGVKLEIYLQSDSSTPDKKFSVILVKCPLYRVEGLFFLLIKTPSRKNHEKHLIITFQR